MTILMAGCKTAGELFDKAISKDEKTVAQKALEKWPCVNGTVIPGDSSAFKDWQKNLLGVSTYYDSLIMSMDKEPRVVYKSNQSDSLNFVQCFDENIRLQNNLELLKGKLTQANKLIAKPPVMHDTIPVKDMKMVYLANRERDDYKDSLYHWQAEYNVLKKDRDDLRGKAMHRGWENWIWRVIAAVLIFLWVWGKIKSVRL